MMRDNVKRTLEDLITDIDASKFTELDICDLGFGLLKYGLGKYDNSFKKLGAKTYINLLEKEVRKCQ